MFAGRRIVSLSSSVPKRRRPSRYVDRKLGAIDQGQRQHRPKPGLQRQRRSTALHRSSLLLQLSNSNQVDLDEPAAGTSASVTGSTGGLAQDFRRTNAPTMSIGKMQIITMSSGGDGGALRPAPVFGSAVTSPSSCSASPPKPSSSSSGATVAFNSTKVTRATKLLVTATTPHPAISSSVTKDCSKYSAAARSTGSSRVSAPP